MEWIGAILTIGSCIVCGACGCHVTRRVRRLEERVVLVEEQRRRQEQEIQVKRLVQEHAVYIPPTYPYSNPEPSAPMMSAIPVRVQ